MLFLRLLSEGETQVSHGVRRAELQQCVHEEDTMEERDLRVVGEVVVGGILPQREAIRSRGAETQIAHGARRGVLQFVLEGFRRLLSMWAVLF